MKQHRNDQDRVAELRRQRLHEAQEAAQQRREKLLQDVTELAAASTHNPAQVGDYVGQMAAAGLLSTGDEALIQDHIVQVAGPEFAEQAFAGVMAERQSESEALLGALVDEWKSARTRIERGRVGNVIDVDSKRAQKTMDLVERIAGFLGLPEREIQVRADEVAAQKTDARGASGLMDGGVVYLHPTAYDPDTASGRYLLGHEMVHMAQRSEFSGAPSTISKQGAEAEAAQLGAQFAAGQSIGRPQFGLPAMDAAADTDASQQQAGDTSGGGGGPPRDFRLSLAGQRFRIRIPSDAQPGRKFTVRDLSIGVGPLTISEAELEFESDWNFKSGKVKASVAAGEGINIDNVELSVDREKRVAATLENVQVELGTYIRATMNLTIGTRGVSGTATIQPSDVNLPGGVSFTGGEISLTVSDGSMSASGRVTANITGLGELALQASISQGGGGDGAPDGGGTQGGASVSGSVEINLAENIQITEGINLNAAKISGSYSEEKGFETSGKVDVTIDGWGKAKLEVGYKKGNQEGAKDLWTVKGRVDQEKGTSFTIGQGEEQLTISEGHVEVDYTDNKLKKVGAGCAFDHAQFSGKFEGSYKVQEKLFSGKGDATLKKAVTLGEGGSAITIHKASGGATIVENKITHIRVKAAKADLPYEGQKTFEIDVKDADYKVKEKQLTGSGTVKTFRDLTFGDTTKQHVKIGKGATGGVSVDKNVITKVKGGLDFSVREGEGEIGNGSVSVDFKNAKSGGDPKLNAKGNFNLTSAYGYPDKAKGPLMVQAGAKASIEVKENAIHTVELKDGKFELTNPQEGKKGKISGTLSGKINFSTAELDAKGSAKVDELWELDAEWGAVEFAPGGSLKVDVEKSKLKAFDGNIEFKAAIAGPGQPILLEGKAKGKYESKTGVFDGSFDTQLKNTLNIPQGEGGANKVVINEGAKVTGKVQTGKLAEVTLDIDFEYHRAGEKFLTGSIKNGKYDLKNKALTVNGKAKLHKKIEKATDDGKWKLVIKKDAEIEIDIAANNLERVGGNVEFEIFRGDKKFAIGHLREADVKDGSFTGEFSVKLVETGVFPSEETRPKDHTGKTIPNFFELKIAKGSELSGKINVNHVSEVKVKLDGEIHLAGKKVATGKLHGDYTTATEELNVDFDFKTVHALGSTRDKANMPAGGKDRIPTWAWLAPAGQQIAGKIVKNAWQKANVNLNVQLYGPEGPGQILGSASCKGSLEITKENPTDTFDGDIKVDITTTTTISNKAEAPTDFEIWVKEGTNFKAKWKDGAFTSASGLFKVAARQGGEERILVDVQGKWAPATGVDGKGVIDVKKDFQISHQDPYKLYIKQGSGGKGKVDATKLTELSGQITLGVAKGEKQFAKGEFKADYKIADGNNAIIDAKGTVELLDEFKAESDTGWKFFIRKGAGIELELAKSKLKYIEGTIEGGVADPKHEFIKFNCHAKYDENEGVNANGQISVTKQHDFFTRGDYKAYLKVGEGAQFKVEKSKLIEVTAKIPMGLSDAKGELISVELTGKYDHQNTRFDGKGTATLARRLTVAENVKVLKQTYSLYVEESTGFIAKVENNEFTYAKGNIDATIEDSEGPFIRASGNITYEKQAGAQEAKVSAERSTSKVQKDKDLVEKQEQGFKLRLKKQDGPQVDVKENSLNMISGSIKVEVVKGEEVWVKGTLGGKWTKEGGFEGKANAELCVPIDVAKKVAGKYDLIVQPGASAEVTLEKSKIKHIGGQVSAKVHDPEGEFLLIKAKADYDYPNKEFSGTGSINVLNPRKLAQIGDFTLNLSKTSGIQGEVKKNEPVWLEGALNLTVDEGASKLADAQVSGKWLINKGEFTGKGTFTLVRDFRLSKNPAADSKLIEQWGLFLSKGSGVQVNVVKNKFQPAEIDVKAHLNKGADTVAKGGIKGTYTIGDKNGFTGGADFKVVKRIEWDKGDRFTTHIDVDTGFKGTATNSQVDSVSGKFILMATEGSEDKIKAEVNGAYAKGKGVTANGAVTVVNDVLISSTSGGYKLYLAKDSGGKATVKDSVLDSINGTVKLRLDKGEEPLAEGDFSVDYKISEGDKAKITSTGTVKIVGEVDMTPQGVGSKNLHFWIVGGSGVSLKITDSDLDWVDGQLKVRIDEGTDPIVDVDIKGKYTAGAQPDFNGEGKASTRRAIDLGVKHKGYSLWLDKGAGAGIKITSMKLDELNADIPLLIKQPDQKDLWKITLNGKYKHADGGQGKFKGSGKAELLIPFEVAKNVGGYDFWLEPGTGAQVVVADNALTKATGTLHASVADKDGKFLKAQGSAEYSNADGKGTLVKLNGKLEVTREKQMLSTAKGYVAWLEKGSNSKVDIKANKVEKISGVVNVRLDKGAEKFARIALKGDYTEATGFNGVGTASLLVAEYFVKQVGKYKVYVTKSKSPLAKITLANSDIKHVGGTVNGRIDDDKGKFVKFGVSADYHFESKDFSGKGSAEIVGDRKLAETTTRTGPESLWLCKGTGANVEVKNNKLQQVGGQINLDLKDSKDTYVKVRLKGTFDAVGGTGFTGEGSVKVTRDKKLADVNGYQFWLAVGAGAHAKIKQNKLEEVGGKVPFKIFTPDNKTEPLLVGSCEGKYLAKTGKFTGNGDIRLGRNVEFNLGDGGAKLVFKKGSGGNASVKDNELTKLGGKLDVDIWDNKGALVNVAAEGEYNAVTNTLVRVEGSAKLLRKMELLDGAIILHNAKGNAKVENNKLKSGHVEATVEIVPLNNMKGHIAVDFCNEGNGWEFWGNGWVDFTLIKNDPQTGRYMGGKVSLDYKRDNTFVIDGKVKYKINHMIGGDIDVKVDEKLDPVIGANFNLTNVPLVKGKNLFEKELDLVPRMDIMLFPPAALNLFFGVKGGAKLDLRPLLFSANIGFQGWRPLSNASEVPDFAVDLALNWGMDFQAMVAAYMGLSLGVQGFNVGAGVEGQLILDVPIEVAPHGRLEGGKKGFSGFLGIGVTIAPNLKAKAIPFVSAVLGPLDFRHEFAEWEIPLGELFKWEWGTKYEFGDREGKKKETPNYKAPAGTEKKKAGKVEGEPRFPTKSAPADNVKGGPQLESGEQAGKSQSKKGSGSEMQQKLDDIKALGEGVGALAKLFQYLIGCLTALATAGPAGLVIYLIIEIVFGDLSWRGIVDAVKAVVKAMRVAARLLEPHLPDWVKAIIKFAQGNRPSLLQALFGADDKARAEVRKGTHRQMPPKGRAKFIDMMISGWTGSADQDCICEILRFSASNGDISSVVRMVDGGADQILSDLTGRHDREARRLFDRSGISY